MRVYSTLANANSTKTDSGVELSSVEAGLFQGRKCVIQILLSSTHYLAKKKKREREVLPPLNKLLLSENIPVSVITDVWYTSHPRWVFILFFYLFFIISTRQQHPNQLIMIV